MNAIITTDSNDNLSMFIANTEFAEDEVRFFRNQEWRMIDEHYNNDGVDSTLLRFYNNKIRLTHEDYWSIREQLIEAFPELGDLSMYDEGDNYYIHDDFELDGILRGIPFRLTFTLEADIERDRETYDSPSYFAVSNIETRNVFLDWGDDIPSDFSADEFAKYFEQ